MMFQKSQLKENLSEKSVPDDVKYRVVDEIARDYCLQPELLAIEYYPGWQQMQQVIQILRKSKKFYIDLIYKKII